MAETAAQDKPKTKRKPPKRKLVEETARRYFAALQARDPDAMAACWSEDGVEDINVVASDRQAAVEWRTVGTFTGEPFEGVEATGGRLELRGLDLLEIENDRILKNTAYYDGAAFMRQLGMLPPQDSGPERAIKSAFNAVNKAKRVVNEKRGQW